jgi:hypothetical protein
MLLKTIYCKENEEFLGGIIVRQASLANVNSRNSGKRNHAYSCDI